MGSPNVPLTYLPLPESGLPGLPPSGARGEGVKKGRRPAPPFLLRSPIPASAPLRSLLALERFDIIESLVPPTSRGRGLPADLSQRTR